MFKRIFFQGVITSILSATAAIIYRRIYFFATEADFSNVLDLQRIIGLNLLICMAAVLINYGLIKWLKGKGEIVFNLLFSIISFTAVMVPISIALPLNIRLPELFPGLAVPMVFFPVIAWYTVNPFFIHKSKN